MPTANELRAELEMLGKELATEIEGGAAAWEASRLFAMELALRAVDRVAERRAPALREHYEILCLSAKRAAVERAADFEVPNAVERWYADRGMVPAL